MFKSSVVLLLSIASAAAFAPAALAPGLQAKRVRSVSLFAPATSLEPKCPPPRASRRDDAAPRGCAASERILLVSLCS